MPSHDHITTHDKGTWTARLSGDAFSSNIKGRCHYHIIAFPFQDMIPVQTPKLQGRFCLIRSTVEGLHECYPRCSFPGPSSAVAGEIVRMRQVIITVHDKCGDSEIVAYRILRIHAKHHVRRIVRDP